MVTPAEGPSSECSRGGRNMYVAIGEKCLVNPESLACDRTQLYAAWIDSTTRPSCPASGGSAALPFSSFLDEENVTTRRCPRQPNRHAGAFGTFGDLALGADLHPAEHVGMLHQFGGDHHLVGLPFRDAACLLAANRSDGPLQVTYARFTRVVAHDEPDCLLGNSIACGSLRSPQSDVQILESDVDLFFFGVTLQFEDLHAVAQRLGNPTSNRFAVVMNSTFDKSNGTSR